MPFFLLFSCIVVHSKSSIVHATNQVALLVPLAHPNHVVAHMHFLWTWNITRTINLVKKKLFRIFNANDELPPCLFNGFTNNDDLFSHQILYLSLPITSLQQVDMKVRFHPNIHLLYSIIITRV